MQSHFSLRRIIVVAVIVLVIVMIFLYGSITVYLLYFKDNHPATSSHVLSPLPDNFSFGPERSFRDAHSSYGERITILHAPKTGENPTDVLLENLLNRGWALNDTGHGA